MTAVTHQCEVFLKLMLRHSLVQPPAEGEDPAEYQYTQMQMLHQLKQSVALSCADAPSVFDCFQVPQRLAAYAAAAGPLSGWLARFSTLRRPLDGSAGLPEVLNGAADILSGILVAKGAAHAAQTAAEAAQRARESAERVRGCTDDDCGCAGTPGKLSKLGLRITCLAETVK